jgi:hypothetical protein
LVALAKKACGDPFSNNAYVNVFERFGVENKFNNYEMKIICDHFYLDYEGDFYAINPQTGEWMEERDPLNDRGDEGSIAARQRGVEMNGILRGQRSGPCFRPQQTEAVNGARKWWTLHWATLFQGAKRAWLADKDKKNRGLQMSLRQPIKGAQFMVKNVTDDACKFYKQYYNLVNNESTATTILEKYRCTPDVTSGFAARKKANGWTLESLGHKQYYKEYFEYACALYEGYWEKHHHLDVSCIVFTQAQKVQTSPVH